MKGLLQKPEVSAVLAVGWMLLIIFLSHQPGFSDNPEHPSFFEMVPELLGNLLHIPEYGVLAAFYWFSCRTKINSIRRLNLTVIALVLLFACSDEFHQSFVIGRYASAMDIVSDIVGAVLAVLMLTLMHRPSQADIE